MVEVEDRLHELVNPKIVRSEGDDRDLEGCLSIPGYAAYVTRREKVWVVAQDRRGRKIKVAGSGLLGRAFQHELDHLDGKLYIDYLDSMDELIAGRAAATTRRASRPRAASDDEARRRPGPAVASQDASAGMTAGLGARAGGRPGADDLLRLRGVRRARSSTRWPVTPGSSSSPS